jgi:hypothetical protein
VSNVSSHAAVRTRKKKDDGERRRRRTTTTTDDDDDEDEDEDDESRVPMVYSAAAKPGSRLSVGWRIVTSCDRTRDEPTK